MSCKVLVLYWSKGGNTRKVAETIHTTVQYHGISCEIREIEADMEIDVFSYELVFLLQPGHLRGGCRALEVDSGVVASCDDCAKVSRDYSS